MKKISGNSNIGFAVDDDMTGTPDSRQRAQPRRQARPRRASATRQLQTQIDAATRLHRQRRQRPAAQLRRHLERHAHPAPCRHYWIYLQALGTNAIISLDGKRLAGTGAFQGGVHGDILQANQDNAIPTTDGLDNVRRAVELTAGPHDHRNQHQPRHLQRSRAGAPQLVHARAAQGRSRAAIAAAKNAKIAVVFLWTRLEPVFGLPGDQDKLVEEVAAVNPNTIVVLNTSQPVALPWVDKVKGRSRNVVAGR